MDFKGRGEINANSFELQPLKFLKIAGLTKKALYIRYIQYKNRAGFNERDFSPRNRGIY